MFIWSNKENYTCYPFSSGPLHINLDIIASLNETVLMRGHNVCFLWSNKENHPCYPFLSGPLHINFDIIPVSAVTAIVR